MCLLLSGRRLVTHSVRPWCWAVAAVSLAALAPLAVESNLYRARADGAFVAMAVGVVLAGSGKRRASTIGGALMAGVACGLDATAIVWPIGWAWAAVARRRGGGPAALVVAASACGVVIAWWGGWPMLATSGLPTAAYSIHRDLTLLLPILVIGGAGYAKANPASRT